VKEIVMDLLAPFLWLTTTAWKIDTCKV